MGESGSGSKRSVYDSDTNTQYHTIPATTPDAPTIFIIEYKDKYGHVSGYGQRIRQEETRAYPDGTIDKTYLNLDGEPVHSTTKYPDGSKSEFYEDASGRWWWERTGPDGTFSRKTTDVGSPWGDDDDPFSDRSPLWRDPEDHEEPIGHISHDQSGGKPSHGIEPPKDFDPDVFIPTMEPPKDFDPDVFDGTNRVDLPPHMAQAFDKPPLGKHLDYLKSSGDWVELEHEYPEDKEGQLAPPDAQRSLGKHLDYLQSSSTLDPIPSEGPSPFGYPPAEQPPAEQPPVEPHPSAEPGVQPTPPPEPPMGQQPTGEPYPPPGGDPKVIPPDGDGDGLPNEYGDGPDLDANGVPDEVGINPDSLQPGYPNPTPADRPLDRTGPLPVEPDNAEDSDTEAGTPLDPALLDPSVPGPTLDPSLVDPATPGPTLDPSLFDPNAPGATLDPALFDPIAPGPTLDAALLDLDSPGPTFHPNLFDPSAAGETIDPNLLDPGAPGPTLDPDQLERGLVEPRGVVEPAGVTDGGFTHPSLTGPAAHPEPSSSTPGQEQIDEGFSGA